MSNPIEPTTNTKPSEVAMGIAREIQAHVHNLSMSAQLATWDLAPLAAIIDRALTTACDEPALDLDYLAERITCIFNGATLHVKYDRDNKSDARVELEGIVKRELRQIVKSTRDAALSEGMAQAGALVPTNWVDSLLTGPDAVLQGKGGTWGCPDIERLLQAIKQRILAASPDPNYAQKIRDEVLKDVVQELNEVVESANYNNRELNANDFLIFGTRIQTFKSPQRK